MKHAQNMLLSRVEGDAPMGDLIRRFWLPAARSDALVPDGAPVRVTICGRSYVAFRTTDGRAGVLDEACPHRCASLMLARNEENGLRCIYHGWKFAVDGSVLEIPTEPPERAPAIAERVPVNRYAVHEAGGVVWVWLGKGQAPPAPTFEFMSLPSSHYTVRGLIAKANWLQNMEAVLDSAHLGFLHRTSILRAVAPSQRTAALWLANTAPQIQVEETFYGLREAALRTLEDGSIYTRIREFVAPMHVMIPGEPNAERQHIVTVPIDDGSSIQFFITYNPFRPMTQAEIDACYFDTLPEDADNLAHRWPGRDTTWGQDRAAMKDGHFSGLTNRHPLGEDMALVESMGPIVDRTKEFLTPTDLTVATVRRRLLESLDSVGKGGPAWVEIGRPLTRLRSQIATLPAGSDWRTLESFAA